MPLSHHMRLAGLGLVLAGISAPVIAQAPQPGTCDLGRAEGSLDASDVHAVLFNTGSLFFGHSAQGGHVVPRFSGRSPFYAAGLWVGGYADGELRVAGAMYNDFEFWPGPLDPATGRPPDPNDCSAYDRVYVASTRDVQLYETTGAATPDLAEWPVHLGAEVVDGDGVPGNYSLAGGDRPRIYGSQTAFWVMNDVGNSHEFTYTEPIGLEVRVHAFSIVSADEAVNRTVVFRYQVLNRGAEPLEDAVLGIWAETEVGQGGNDAVGVDTSRGLGYGYNGTASDGTCPRCYGMTPPAAGFDLLDGAGAFWYVGNGWAQPTGDPYLGSHVYRIMRGRWNDGTPITYGGIGFNPGSTDTTTFAFPGDPVTAQYWSMACPEAGCGAALFGNVRQATSTPTFTLAAGAERTFDVALLFGAGVDHLDSITRLREASDIVQAMHDDGPLFDTVDPAGSLPPPVLTYPHDGQNVMGALPVELAWEPVAGAEGYVVEVWNAMSPGERTTTLALEPGIAVHGCGRPNRLHTCEWRVRADAPSTRSMGMSSTIRSFRAQAYEAGILDDGRGIIEVARPAGSSCPDPADDGCRDYAGEGNTVFRDPDVSRDYFVSGSGLHQSWIGGLSDGGRFDEVASPDDYEMRFSLTGGLAVYSALASTSLPRYIAHVPFEVWNVGATPDDPSDDVRMIPVLSQFTSSGPVVTEWGNAFTGAQRGLGLDTVAVTEPVAFLYPDRPNGYDLFEQAAIGFGGPGALYDPGNDGDAQVDINPATGEPCTRQGYYVAFCTRNDRLPSSQATGYSAALTRLVFADLARDGTTPPAGTVIRFKTARHAPVAAAPGAPSSPASIALRSPRPNPATGVVTVGYDLPVAVSARLEVVDVTGRVVTGLDLGRPGSGSHATTLDLGDLAPGVYILRLVTPVGRASRGLTIIR